MKKDLLVTETTCPYCGVGCGVTITQTNQQLQPVSGMSKHPANFGRLCVKGSALHETVDHQQRLLFPTMNGKSTSWETALTLVADKIRQVINDHGPDAVAFYGSGQLLTEDYYVANKLMKGFIGSANMDTNSRLCMASAVASYKRSLGSDTVPGNYEDLELADLLIITGSNAAWAHPILFQRISAAKKARPEMKVVVIDPRKTATCDIADVHLAIRPGTDTLLFNALLSYCDEINALDTDFIERHCEHFDVTINAAREGCENLDQLAQITNTSVDDLVTFFELFATTSKTVTLYSQGINQSKDGTDKANSIINVHLATGRIGKPGACPFSITGQPNAMGGREVGGLANQLAAHMDFSTSDRDRVKRFWKAPNIAARPGLKAVDLFEAVKAEKIKFLWIMSTNPLVSMPDADDVKAALKHCELVVVSDCMASTDTTKAAHVLLPAASWGEKNGTVTNSERCISRQRSFLPPPGEAKPDWWIITQVAHHLGYEDAFPYQHPSEIFAEHVALSAFENNGSRDFDLSGLQGINQAEYDALAPIQWPINSSYPKGRARFYDDNHFYTPSGKANFIPVIATLPSELTDSQLLMNTGRIRDHWHTMTRTGKSARLAQHISEPYADMHSADAKKYNINDGDLIKVSNLRGNIIVRAKVHNDQTQRIGEIFVPMHWTSRYASLARMGSLIDKTNDPISGQPALKQTAVSIAPYAPQWQGFVLSKTDLGAPDCEYWAYNLTPYGHVYDVAGQQSAAEFINRISCDMDQGEWLRMSDAATNHYRLAHLIDGCLERLVFIHQDKKLPTRQWLTELFAKDTLTLEERKALLAGSLPGAKEDTGRIICSCFQVGEKTIINAIESGCDSASVLGEQLKCGTNCGSCIPELKSLLTAHVELET